ncbi:MAG: hypothetical protein FGF48_03650 [Candidatus Brockarchaeota archaeon]|nr:hypothetical protein [Candidatus Brockarchaeota archaeon]
MFFDLWDLGIKGPGHYEFHPPLEHLDEEGKRAYVRGFFSGDGMASVSGNQGRIRIDPVCKEGLFYVAFNEESTKIRFVEIGLFDEMLSTTVKYRNTLEEVEKALGERERILVDKFMNNPKIKEVARGRKVIMIPQIYLLCELESKIANKITIEVIHEDDFAAMKNLLNSLTDMLIQRGFATRVAGYELGRNIEDYKLGDIDVWGDEVTVWLVWRSAEGGI